MSGSFGYSVNFILQVETFYEDGSTRGSLHDKDSTDGTVGG